MEWKEGQKVGVFLYTYTGTPLVKPAVIVKVGKTRVTLDNGDQFTVGGIKVGSDRWTPTRIQAWDDDVQRMHETSQREQRRAQLASKIDGINWRKAPLDDLEAVVAVLVERGMIGRESVAKIPARVMADSKTGL